MHCKSLVVILTFYPCFVVVSQSRDSLYLKTSSFEEFWNRINYSKKVENNNFFSLEYGKHLIDFDHKDLISRFSDVYSLKIVYGFHRKEQVNRGDSIYYLASEGIYLQNTSSHLIFRGMVSSGKTTDAWGFGFKYLNGYGSENLIFIHSGSLSWIKLDIEEFAESPAEQKVFDIFDGKFRFGESYSSIVRYYFFENIGLDFSYEHQLYFSKTLFGKWLVGAGLELIIQRGIDYFGPEISSVLGRYYFVLNWISKTLVSFVFSELQRDQMYFPFKSEKALNYRGLNFGLIIVF